MGNARGPVVRAMIMDLVPTERRGRWNSIQSISGFTWSGSAALGGYIADVSGDYRFTFVVTAMVYTFSGLLSVPLLFCYPQDFHSVRTAVASQSQPEASLPIANRAAMELLDR